MNIWDIINKAIFYLYIYEALKKNLWPMMYI